jgi:hypothetical protein
MPRNASEMAIGALDVLEGHLCDPQRGRPTLGLLWPTSEMTCSASRVRVPVTHSLAAFVNLHKRSGSSRLGAAERSLGCSLLSADSKPTGAAMPNGPHVSSEAFG